MNFGPVRSEVWAAVMMVLSRREDQVRLLPKSHCIADLQVTVGPFVRDVRDDDLRALDELHNLALKEVALAVQIHTAWSETGIPYRRINGLVAHRVQLGIADLHDHERLLKYSHGFHHGAR